MNPKSNKVGLMGTHKAYSRPVKVCCGHELGSRATIMPSLYFNRLELNLVRFRN